MCSVCGAGSVRCYRNNVARSVELVVVLPLVRALVGSGPDTKIVAGAATDETAEDGMGPNNTFFNVGDNSVCGAKDGSGRSTHADDVIVVGAFRGGGSTVCVGEVMETETAHAFTSMISAASGVRALTFMIPVASGVPFRCYSSVLYRHNPSSIM